ncbi:MAG: LamG domain-containing protein, partial [Patescibacteria group bacterium]
TSSAIVAGKLGKALKFDGIGNYIDAEVANFPAGASSRTVALWVKRSTSANFTENDYLFRYGNPASAQGFGLYSNIGATTFTFYGNAYDFDTGITLGDTNWHQIILTFDGTNLRAYKDGVLISTTDRSGLNTVLSTYKFRVGAGLSPSQYFNGLIDDVRIYNRALTYAEIQQLYNSR